MEKLTDEIIVNVLKYLNSFDLIQICEAGKCFEHLLRERKLMYRMELIIQLQSQQRY